MATSTPIPSAAPSASPQVQSKLGKLADDAALGPLAFLQLLQDVQRPQQTDVTLLLQPQSPVSPSVVVQEADELLQTPESEQAQAALLPWLQNQEQHLLKQESRLPASVSVQDAEELAQIPGSEQTQAALLPWLQNQEQNLPKPQPQLSVAMTQAEADIDTQLPILSQGERSGRSKMEALTSASSNDVWMTPEQAVFMHALNGTKSSAVDDVINGALPQVAIGHTIATVAAGVQSMETLSGQQTQAAMGAQAVGLASGVSQLTQSGSEVVGQVLDDTPLEASDDGRVLLQDGVWQVDDGDHLLSSPAIGRMVGQIEQWVAANAGWGPLRRLSEQAGSSSQAAGQDATAEYAAGASGTRLTDVAVQESQQVADAAMPDAQSEAFTEKLAENMRFWLQGRQQRAEVTLDRNGQSVRVQVLLNGNEAHVTFHSDQAQTRDLLDAGLSQLRDMLAQQGVELAGVSVQAQTAQQGQTQWTDNSQLSKALGSGALRMRQAQVTVPDAVDGRSVDMQRPMNGLDVYA